MSTSELILRELPNVKSFGDAPEIIKQLMFFHFAQYIVMLILSLLILLFGVRALAYAIRIMNWQKIVDPDERARYQRLEAQDAEKLPLLLGGTMAVTGAVTTTYITVSCLKLLLAPHLWLLGQAT